MNIVTRLAAAALCASLIGAGCASSYAVPGGPADMSGMASPSTGGTRDGLGGRISVGAPSGGNAAAAMADAAPVPMARFPAMVSVARVQSVGYESRDVRGYGDYGSQFSVITTRDVETDDTMARVQRMPGVAGLAPINRLLIPRGAPTEAGLREAARRVNADVLVLYTFDTQFYVKDFARPVSIVTLGLSPNKRAYVSTTATALITDARTGYVYGGAETTEKSEQLSNGWTSRDAVDDTRRRTEGRAFDKLVGELEKTWPTIVTRYGQPAGQATGQTTGTPATMPVQ